MDCKAYDWTAIGDNPLWTPTNTYSIHIKSFILCVEETCTVTVYYNSNTLANRIFKGAFSDKGGLCIDFSKALEIANNLTTGYQVRIAVSGGKGSITMCAYEVPI